MEIWDLDNREFYMDEVLEGIDHADFEMKEWYCRGREIEAIFKCKYVDYEVRYENNGYEEVILGFYRMMEGIDVFSLIRNKKYDKKVEKIIELRDGKLTKGCIIENEELKIKNEKNKSDEGVMSEEGGDDW